MNAKKDRQDNGKRRRTGCWPCKERKVRCNEARPICNACERLTLPCQYGIKLLWREEALSRGIALGRSGLWSKKRGVSNQKQHQDVDSNFQHDRPPTPQDERVDALPLPTEDWMFLNTTYQDFKHYLDPDNLCNGSMLDEASSYAPFWPSPAFTTIAAPRTLDGRCWDSEDPLVATPRILDGNGWDFGVNQDVNIFQADDVDMSLMPTNRAHVATCSNPIFCWPIVQNPSPFALGDNEMYLLNYFTHGVSPRCTTWPADNPFARTILPVCMSALDKPLFNIVMAVASHQLSLLNDSRFKRDIWIYRGKAIRSFQAEIGQLQSRQEASVDWEQIISTLVMLTFFDISHDSASAWWVHLRCARNLRSLLPTQAHLSTGQKELYRFFCAYFAQHEALSRTTSALSDPYDGWSIQWFPPELGLDMSVIDSLLGCSHELISLISNISDLAAEMQLQSCGSHKVSDNVADIQPEQLATLKERHDEIERRLHGMIQHLPPTTPSLPGYEDHDSGTLEELGYIAETRRLSALIYLYFRVDGVSPGHSPISRLTDQILSLIPKISLRSHVLLWTLFIVGTMGISQSDGDSDRKFILERLVSLQHTRELENVRIAREVVEAVWKMRDLRGPESVGGWKDIVNAGGEGLSLC
ncbi:fungal-specific transcription factor domain-containing protein [Ilyonectria sp. MPI-CAGE-AT-0026]|nr:fungal-specific transcription factor domain-containing protein [Ilyonectria sp. MPI-CAGE-AT-0026]